MTAERTVTSIKQLALHNVFMATAGNEELLCTLSKHADEGSIIYDGLIFRPWSPASSKLSSLILKGMKIPIHKDSKILYLGAASGTTVGHVSDIAEDGLIYAVEFASRPSRDLLKAVEMRENVIPIFADARLPDSYPPFIDNVDMIYQDVAQPDQSGILIVNANKYLKSGGYAIIAIKARSINISENIGTIFEKEAEKLEKDFEIIENVSLEPLHKDHLALLCKYRK
jgi:fibrillarin-like pre-rRNA processing protein